MRSSAHRSTVVEAVPVAGYSSTNPSFTSVKTSWSPSTPVGEGSVCPRSPDAAFIALAPDWICEILSRSTEAVDRGEKVPIYAREGVRHIWLIDPIVKTLEVLRLDGASYRIVGTWHDGARVRAEPFDAIELDLAALWAR